MTAETKTEPQREDTYMPSDREDAPEPQREDTHEQ